MIEETINTLTTIEIDENVTVIETSKVGLVTVSIPGVQGAKGEKGDRGEGISEYTQQITGLGEFVTHNLDRHLDPDQVVFNETDCSTLTVACENIDSSGNFSKNTCKIISNTAMNGLLRLK